MYDADLPTILCVDDDIDTLRILERFLRNEGYNVFTAQVPAQGLEMVQRISPDLILLDLVMPEMDGFEFCVRLHESRQASWVPVVFLTARGLERDKMRAFAAGASDYLVKPTSKPLLLEVVRRNLGNAVRWQVAEGGVQRQSVAAESSFEAFKEFLAARLRLTPELVQAVRGVGFRDLYSLSQMVSLSEGKLALLAAVYLGWDYRERIGSDDIAIGTLPPRFCRRNLVIPLQDGADGNLFALANPFNIEVLDVLRSYSAGQQLRFVVADPAVIAEILLQAAYD